MKLPELEQSLLRAARESLSPSVDDRQRHESALLARLDAAALSGTVSPGLPRSDGRGAFGASGSISSGIVARGSMVSGVVARLSPHVVRGRLELVAIGLAVGAVFGGAVGFVLGRGLNGSAAADRAELSHAVAGDVWEGHVEPAASVFAEKLVAAEGGGVMAAEQQVAEGATPALAAASGEADVIDFDAVVAASHGSAAPAARDRRSHHLAAGNGKPESSLAIELAMLQRARRALGADNGRLALGIVQELDERFPKGVLIEERRATRVLSLCLLGRTQEARRFGSEFLARHADSVYAERVRASCAVDGR